MCKVRFNIDLCVKWKISNKPKVKEAYQRKANHVSRSWVWLLNILKVKSSLWPKHRNRKIVFCIYIYILFNWFIFNWSQSVRGGWREGNKSQTNANRTVLLIGRFLAFNREPFLGKTPSWPSATITTTKTIPGAYAHTQYTYKYKSTGSELVLGIVWNQQRQQQQQPHWDKIVREREAHNDLR